MIKKKGHDFKVKGNLLNLQSIWVSDYITITQVKYNKHHTQTHGFFCELLEEDSNNAF